VNIQRKPRGEFVYIDARAFPQLEADEPRTITIGPEPADVGQQPWPTYPTLWDIHGQYLREWVVPQKCDLSRTVAALFRTYRVWDPTRDPARARLHASGRPFSELFVNISFRAPVVWPAARGRIDSRRGSDTARSIAGNGSTNWAKHECLY
jgi:hypothetical protein